jgi:hypothetical protein
VQVQHAKEGNKRISVKMRRATQMVILIKIPPAFLIELPALKENASIEKDRPFYIGRMLQ